ncbi:MULTISPECIES: VOC family protein [unclassified Streptomyces]|uniref:VOC family protein n=1 Tax=unclassified Streptomyces TaxID=2593676 RepID=UPI002E360D0F|nr:VOC family protein [Streptomyces sp. NBC_01428]
MGFVERGRLSRQPPRSAALHHPGGHNRLARIRELRDQLLHQALADDSPDTPAHWQTSFAVDDVDSALDTLVRSGGTVLAPPSDVKGGRMAVVADPQGARFAMITPQPQ